MLSNLFFEHSLLSAAIIFHGFDSPVPLNDAFLGPFHVLQATSVQLIQTSTGGFKLIFSLRLQSHLLSCDALPCGKGVLMFKFLSGSGLRSSLHILHRGFTALTE